MKNDLCNLKFHKKSLHPNPKIEINLYLYYFGENHFQKTSSLNVNCVEKFADYKKGPRLSSILLWKICKFRTYFFPPRYHNNLWLGSWPYAGAHKTLYWLEDNPALRVPSPGYSWQLPSYLLDQSSFTLFVWHGVKYNVENEILWGITLPVSG